MSKLRKAAEISKARVLIVDDQPVVRERLGQLVSSEPDMVFCGDADDPRMALELAAATEPDVIVTGLSLKDSHGLEFIKDLHLRYPSFRVLVFSMYDESLYAERAIRAGASGFVTKREPTKEVLRAIRCLLRGEFTCSTGRDTLRAAQNVVAGSKGHGARSGAMSAMARGACRFDVARQTWPTTLPQCLKK